MKLSPMIVQGLLNNKSPLLQLPHITESHLRFFETKKVEKFPFFVYQNRGFLLADD
jgi:translocation protein SEC63